MVRTLSLLVTVAGVLLALLPLLVEKGSDPQLVQRALVAAMASLLTSVASIIVGEGRESAIPPSSIGVGTAGLFLLSVALFGLMTAIYGMGVLSITAKTRSKQAIS